MIIVIIIHRFRSSLNQSNVTEFMEHISFPETKICLRELSHHVKCLQIPLLNSQKARYLSAHNYVCYDSGRLSQLTGTAHVYVYRATS
jgi:hypothetical protein